jgi:hypothetical protein
LWNEAKQIPVPTFQEWTEANKQALVKLEETVELEGMIALQGDIEYGPLVLARQC